MTFLVGLWFLVVSQKTRSISVVSSAYRMLFMCTSPIWIPPSRFLISFITNSKNKLKRLGDRGHHCLTPVPTLNPLTVTEHSDCSYMLWISPTMTLSTPIAFIHFHRASLQMVSNAALKSIKCSNGAVDVFLLPSP